MPFLFTWMVQVFFGQAIQSYCSLIRIKLKIEIMKKESVLKSIITCSNCVYQKEETMPIDACQYFMNVKIANQDEDQIKSIDVYFVHLEQFHVR